MQSMSHYSDTLRCIDTRAIVNVPIDITEIASLYIMVDINQNPGKNNGNE